MKRTLLFYLTDLGLFFFISHIFVFSVAGGIPLYGACAMFAISLTIRVLQHTKLLIPMLDYIPANLGRQTFQDVLSRNNVTFFINGLFLLILGGLTLFDLAARFDDSRLMDSLLVAANGFGFGFANILKSAELDGLWILPRKETIFGNIISSLGRPESLSVFASFPTAILANTHQLYLILPFLVAALIMTLHTGKNTLDNRFLSQPKRVLVARLFIACSNGVASFFGFMDNRIAVSIALLMFFIGNCVVAYRTYTLQNDASNP